MEGIIKFLVIAFIVYYSLKLVGRYILPFLLKIWIKRMTQKFGNMGGFQQNNQEESTTIRKEPEPKKKIIPKDQGEYIDFEEVK